MILLVTGRRVGIALLLAGSAIAGSPAVAATCTAAGATELTVGTAVRVDPGAARSFAVQLGGGEGVIIDLSRYAAEPKASDDDAAEGTPAGPPRNLVLCSASGAVLAPQPGEVFEKGGSVATTPDGTRLKFVAPTPGRYIVAVDASDAAREVLVRSRKLDAGGSVVATRLGESEVKAMVSSKLPVTYSFAGTAGQWVELKATSENDTVLHLAGPDHAGNYSEIASNDDSDGLNPLIRRKLPVTGTYYLQVDALGDEIKEFTLGLAAIAAPAPPPPPTPLRAGATVTGSLANQDDKKLYTLPVVAGHSYRLDLTAPYDGVVAIGLPNPVESEDGDAGGFSEVKSQDTGTSGTEKLNFTARTSGSLLVQIRSFGIGESDGAYTLVVSDLGG
ncbi:MAG TPA: PPC domain-containing protein [Novosphingobium sp.]|nr:PPC domain-containing protein [Novosphingobium sp.]